MKSRKRISASILLGFCLMQPVWPKNPNVTGMANLEKVPLMPLPDATTSAGKETRAGVSPSPPEFANKAQYDRMVAEVAQTYGLNSALLHAVISAESRYIADAVSRRGAAGLMQLMPATARRYGVADPFDPVQNLNGGAKCLRDLLKRFNDNVSLALAAYNAGRGAVIRHGTKIPPIRETEAYVQRVLSYYWRYQLEQAGVPQSRVRAIRERV